MTKGLLRDTGAFCDVSANYDDERALSSIRDKKVGQMVTIPSPAEGGRLAPS